MATSSKKKKTEERTDAVGVQCRRGRGRGQLQPGPAYGGAAGGVHQPIPPAGGPTPAGFSMEPGRSRFSLPVLQMDSRLGGLHSPTHSLLHPCSTGPPDVAKANEPENEAYFGDTLKGLEDVTLVVEGRQLRMNRAILAHHSPVFHAMFYSDFKEKGETSVPLPGEKYTDMVTFLKLLFPRDPSSEDLISDTNLLQLLVRADKYDTAEVKSRCQDYIGKQLMVYFRDLSDNRPTSKLFGTSVMQNQKPDIINKLSLYLRACHDYDLPNYEEKLKSLIVGKCRGMTDLSSSQHYSFFSLILKVELLEALCRKFNP